MPSSMLIIGAGGFGRESLDVVEAMNAALPATERIDFLGFLDPAPNMELLAARSAPWLGGDELMRQYAGAGFVVAIGAPATRRRLAGAAESAGLQPVTLIHPSATIGAAVEIGAGSVICSHVSITTNIHIGRHVQLHVNATVGHDAVLEDFVTVTPGSTVSGGVTLKTEVWMGANSTVIEGLTVGNRSVIGAGAAAIRDIPADVVAVGVPAKVRDMTSR